MSQESKAHIGNPKQHFVVVHNVRAGRKKENSRDRIENFFETRDLSYEIIETDTLPWDQLTQKINTYDEVRFIAAGGDGTLRRVFQELWEHDVLDVCSVAFLPLGSANVTAISFRLPFGFTRALRRAVRGTPKHVDLGLVNNKYIFFIMVSFGTVARVTIDTKRNMKKLFGVFAYLLSLPSLLRHPYKDEAFTICNQSDEKKETHSLMVCNHLNVAGLSPLRGITPSDGNLHSITLHNKTPWGFLRVALDFYLTTKNSNVLRHTRIQKECFTFESFSGEVHIDGDTVTDLGNTVEFCVLPHAAKLVT